MNEIIEHPFERVPLSRPEVVPVARPLNPLMVAPHDARVAPCAPATYNAASLSPAALAPFAFKSAPLASTGFGLPATQLAPPHLLPPREACCVASAVCGLTALVPVFSQIAGLVLGLVGLARIRAARRRGENLRGAGWAIAGLCSSGLMLLCWLGMFAALASVGSVLNKTTGKLPFSTRAE